MHALTMYSTVLTVTADEAAYGAVYAHACPHIPVVLLIGKLTLYRTLQYMSSYLYMRTSIVCGSTCSFIHGDLAMR